MSCDYVPHSELKLTEWAGKFVAFMAEHAAELGMTPEELAALQSQYERFDTAYAAHMAAQTAARVARSAKDDARKPLLKSIRSIAMRVQSHRAFDNKAKTQLGLTVGKRKHPRLTLSHERPTAALDIGQRLKHTLRIMNQTPKGTRRARPANLMGCEIWCKIGDRPSGPEDMRYVDCTRRNPVVVKFSAADAGKQAYYKLRWVSRRGEKGDWSPTQSATIAA